MYKYYEVIRSRIFLKTINGLIPAHVKFCHQIHFGAKLTKKFSFPISDFRTASEALCI